MRKVTQRQAGVDVARTLANGAGRVTVGATIQEAPMIQTRSRYSAVSMALHWVVAALVIGQVLLISAADQEGPNRALWIATHKANGISILLLTLLRLGWRLKHPAIPLPATTPRWQRLAARTTHILFYVVLVAMPLTGWLASSAAGRGFEWYGLFNWPLLPVGGGRETAGLMMAIHGAVVKSLYILIALHIAGALKHYFIDRDNVLQRMLPFLRQRA